MIPEVNTHSATQCSNYLSNILSAAQYLTCNGLLQRAEVGVKDRLTGVIDALQPSGTSNWTEGIMMAFQSYKMSEEAELSAGCRRVLVIFTDETSQDLDVSS